MNKTNRTCKCLRSAALTAALLIMLVFALACSKHDLLNTLVEVNNPTGAGSSALPEATGETPLEAQKTDDAGQPGLTAEPTALATELPSEEPSQTPELNTTATMMFVGDLMCLSGQQRGAKSQSDGSYEFDFRPSFEYVRHLISRADCAVGNLETCLSPSAPYSTQLSKFDDGMPNVNGPQIYLMAVKYAGFDALVLANNHCLDAGVTGTRETVDAVESYGFAHTGLFRSPDEKRYTMLDVQGIKVALLSYTEFFNYRESLAADVPYIINKYSKEVLKRDVADAKADGAELVVAYNHWGAENTHQPTEKVRRHAQEMADAGVDVIMGSHSHAVQPSVWLTAADGRKVLCVYSLGNFVSSMRSEMANDTFVVELQISRKNGSVKVTDESYHPAKVFQTLEQKWYVCVPTEDAQMPSIRNELEKAHKRIMDVIMAER